MTTFREGTHWDSGVCGFRPATEKLTCALEKTKNLREQTYTYRNMLDTYSPMPGSSFCYFIVTNAGEAYLCYSKMSRNLP